MIYFLDPPRGLGRASASTIRVRGNHLEWAPIHPMILIKGPYPESLLFGVRIPQVRCPAAT